MRLQSEMEHSIIIALKIVGFAGLVLGLALPLWGQQLEPGAYSVSPPGVNLLLLSNNLAGGDVNFDPSLPVEEASATINTTTISYFRSMSVFGRSANVGVGLPVAAGNVQGIYTGELRT